MVPGPAYWDARSAGRAARANSPEISSGCDLDGLSQSRSKVAQTTGRQTLKFGGEFSSKNQSNGPLVTVNRLETCFKIESFGFPAARNNPALESSQALPLAYAGYVPSIVRFRPPGIPQGGQVSGLRRISCELSSRLY